MKKITKNTKLSEILEINPNAAETLFDIGMHCLGCPMAMQETLEQGCLAHGMSKKEIDELIKKLNKKESERFKEEMGGEFSKGKKDGPLRKLKKFIKEGK